MSLIKRIIPCLDIYNGKVVKGINFLNLNNTGDPVKIAKKYYKEGADEIIFLDISASLKNKKTILNIIKEVSSCVFIPITVGGGIKSLYDVELLLNIGADRISINTSAVNNPLLINNIAKKYGSQSVVVAIDVKNNKNNKFKWEVFTYGGNYATGIDLIDWVKKIVDLGAGEILITSMDRDGTYKGFDLNLLKSISNITNIPIIASGGAGNLKHLVKAIKIGNADAVLAASIFHYNLYSIKEVKSFLLNNNIYIKI